MFEAALALRWDELRRDLVPLTVLATFGVIVAAILVFLGMRYFVGWDWRPALMFGVLISATDPVSVIAMLKESGTGGRLRLLVEGESLFNDGVAAALFAVVAFSVVVQGLTVKPLLHRIDPAPKPPPRQ